MNVVHPFNPRFHELLNIPYRPTCRREVSKYLNDYVKKNSLLINECSECFLKVDDVLGELMGTPYPKVYLNSGHRKVTDWWDVVTMIDKRWRL